MQNTTLSSLKLCLLIIAIICIADKTAFSQSYWAPTGNAISSGNFLGTTTNEPIVFKVNTHQAMVILANGNVGIGTADPHYALQVVGDVLDSGTIYADYIESANGFSVGQFRIVDGVVDSIVSTSGILQLSATTINADGALTAAQTLTAGTHDTAITINGNTGTITSGLHTVSFANDTITTTGKLKAAGINISGNSVVMPGIVTDTATDLMTVDIHGNIHAVNNAELSSIIYQNNWNPDPCEAITGPTTIAAWSGLNGAHPILYTASGCTYVGIDVNTPTVPLEVGGNATILGVTTSVDVSVADYVSICPGYCIGNAALYIKPSPSYTTTIEADSYKTGHAVFTVDTGGSTYMAGNVGILTQPSSYALDVAGTIHGSEVKVCTPMPCDFVFDKDYNLLSLDSLECYLQMNHHLPGIASAKEMEAEGSISLGKMDSQLLQKVEELTLYILQQQKEIKNLEEKVDALSKK